MSFTTIDGYMLRRFIINGANLLIENKDKIDALNVFPVPDGDTGTNMSMTAKAAAEFASATNTPNIYEVALAASKGALRGARGNSGVILSQVYRGLAKGLEGKDTANCRDFAKALEMAKETAYKAVMKPKEGTILTIVKALSDKAQEAAQYTDNIEEFLKLILTYGEKVLKLTPEMLPQLKQAGVVDAGGKGLLLVVRGGYENIGVEGKIATPTESTATVTPAGAVEEDIRFTYCTEFFINLKSPDFSAEEELKSYLSTIGDSIVAVALDDIIKIHVHTNNPGLVLERALKVGELDKIKIENMHIQHTNLISFAEETKKEPPKEYGFVAVAAGEGLKQIFTDLGCDKVINGGQTMNPSTEDILTAIKGVNAETVYVLPNNKNIIMAAKQAGEMLEDKKVVTVETTSVPQGIAALIAFMPTDSPEENKEAMEEAKEAIVSGSVTHAVRSTTVNDKEIREGDYLFLKDEDIDLVGTDLKEGIIGLVGSMLKDIEDPSLVTLYYGEDIDEKAADEIYNALTDYYAASEEFDTLDFDMQKGGQSVYYYIISVE